MARRTCWGYRRRTSDYLGEEDSQKFDRSTIVCSVGRINLAYYYT